MRENFGWQIRRWVVALCGFLVLATGINLTLLGKAAGIDPWNVLHVGISRHFPLTVGQANVAVGLLLVGVAWRLGVPPTLVTGANAVAVGFLVDVVRGVLPAEAPKTLAGQWLFLLFGSVLSGIGIAMYMSTGLGAGPRDSTMLGLSRLLRLPIGYVRIVMEVVVTAIGWVMGGPAGLGTVASALIVGPVVQWSLGKLRALSQPSTMCR
ncbi:MAG: YczE/YyaS/YitT family protein [Bacillota bacterium]